MFSFGGSASLQSGKWALRLVPALGLLLSASTLRAADNPGGGKVQLRREVFAVGD